jgi:hypothetical protein
LIGDDRWQVFESEDLSWREKWIGAHHRMAEALTRSLDGEETEIELCDGRTAKALLDMAMAVHASHVSGRRISFPHGLDQNPFDAWKCGQSNSAKHELDS